MVVVVEGGEGFGTRGSVVNRGHGGLHMPFLIAADEGWFCDWEVLGGGSRWPIGLCLWMCVP